MFSIDIKNYIKITIYIIIFHLFIFMLHQAKNKKVCLMELRWYLVVILNILYHARGDFDARGV